ncbi:5-hydroxytryptamine receptor-like isoform X2 [Anthonomus grandis grandis]|uniref:5-hydroxytryptamine receptor-like isoform X2 n=1 Tax=Anthonomus grandis grandis TaxID=2921223 RepID=UPI0021659702|nr:5-hydroxytryptamine receptor-like isoform X2 [Anthonomus grandis grandis]
MDVVRSKRGKMWSRAAFVFLPHSVYAASSQIYDFPPPNNRSSRDTTIFHLNCSSSICFINETEANSTSTTNDTFLGLNDYEPLADVILMGALSVVLGLMILVTVIGNVFVIAAIVLERNLQNVANYLIVSLAMADLMVACLVMPLGAVYVISNNWIMGPELCDMWTSIDVLCCTASILHLVAIALDRYWAVTNVDYIHTRNSSRISIMIFAVWVIALVVSLAPQIPQFKDPEYLYRIQVKRQCLVSQDVKYQIFATSSTFYVPLLVIFVLYWKIFQAARNRIRKRRELKQHNFEKVEKINNNSSRIVCLRLTSTFLGKKRFLRVKKSVGKNPAAEALVNSLVMMEGQSTTTMEILEEHEEPTSSNDQEEETTAFTISRPPTGDGGGHQQIVNASNNVSPEKSSTNNGSTGLVSHISDASKTEILQKDPITAHQPPPASANLPREKHPPSRRDKKESLEAKRERKAAKTLAIITGAFVMCWLPFFILALVMPLCADSCSISEFIMSFALWLGYFNSTLNPVIYTIFNPEFRQAFKRILCGGHRRHRNFRSGKIR